MGPTSSSCYDQAASCKVSTSFSLTGEGGTKTYPCDFTQSRIFFSSTVIGKAPVLST